MWNHHVLHHSLPVSYTFWSRSCTRKGRPGTEDVRHSPFLLPWSKKYEWKRACHTPNRWWGGGTRSPGIHLHPAVQARVSLTCKNCLEPEQVSTSGIHRCVLLGTLHRKVREPVQSQEMTAPPYLWVLTWKKVSSPGGNTKTDQSGVEEPFKEFEGSV